MQAIHNNILANTNYDTLFQRAKIQVKCKQFTTNTKEAFLHGSCFKEQRYKLNASNSQLTFDDLFSYSCCFKEQRYKLNASNSQLLRRRKDGGMGCFKEQRYKLNASNSQRIERFIFQSIVVSKSKDTS